VDKYKILAQIIKVSPSVGYVGDKITLVGNGYPSSDEIQNANLYWPTTTNWKGQIPLQKEGTFFYTFYCDTLPAGKKDILVQALAADDVDNFIVKGRIYSVLPNRGHAQSNITVKGHGYVAEDYVRIYFVKSESPITEGYISKQGTFSFSFNIDELGKQPFGTKTITAKGTIQIEGAVQIDTDIFFIIGRIFKIKPTEGYVGTEVTVEGDGYITKETIIIDFGETKGITTVVIH
jgi:hypothetical protein